MDTKYEKEYSTLFYQGIGCSQTQALNYVGKQIIKATTGQSMWANGRNYLPPLNVIYKLFIGKEISDVNLHPFNSYFSYLNPLKLISAAATWALNWYSGYQFAPAVNPTTESVAFHTPVFSNVSIGQETDIKSHKEKYDSWLASKDKTDGLILWGVSRGAATTFCAYARYKYPEVKLVVLEGAIDSFENVLPKNVSSFFGSGKASRILTTAIHSGFSLFNKLNLMQYQSNGPAPLNSVNDFPEGVPVVFITSKIDFVVPCANTERLAKALADRGKNDVYLLKLERSSHPSYMYDDRHDHDNYESFIHAIYRKYNMRHDPELADKGEHLLATCTLSETDANKGHPLANNKKILCRSC